VIVTGPVYSMRFLVRFPQSHAIGGVATPTCQESPAFRRKTLPRGAVPGATHRIAGAGFAHPL